MGEHDIEDYEKGIELYTLKETAFFEFLYPNIGNKKIKYLYVFLIPLFVGFSRIILGVHYFSDVLISVILAWLLSIWENIYKKNKNIKQWICKNQN